MANAMVALATTTLGSAASSVTFGSIPATYRDLRLVSLVPSLSGAPLASGAWIRFNSDSGANYNTVYAYGNGSATGSGTEVSVSTLFWGAFPAAGGMANLDILDYSATDKHKSVLGRADGNGGSTWMHAGRWASTSAITSILLEAPDTGTKTFAAGSTFSLYGIAS